MARRGRRPHAAVAAVAAIGVLAAFAAVAAVAMPRTRAASRQEVQRYQDAIHPLVTEWGRVEVQGMRPAIGDLRSGQGVPAETVAGEARAWRAAFESLRDRLRAVRAPKGLRRASELFDRSMARYLEATVAFERAAEAPPGPDRDRGIDRGIELARDGAALYNQASMVLQDARRRAGLPPSEDFPDHEAGQP